MLDPDEQDSAGLPLAARAVFINGPDKRLKLSILYPATTGRNFNEVFSQEQITLDIYLDLWREQHSWIYYWLIEQFMHAE